MFDSPAGSARHRPARTPGAVRTGLTTLLATAAIGASLSGSAGASPPRGPAGETGLFGALTGPLARPHGPGTAIVILGYGLLPDGGMRTELAGRLRAGYVQALLAPWSPVVGTGGNPRNGVTEAAAMADWLVRRGIHGNGSIWRTRPRPPLRMPATAHRWCARSTPGTQWW